MKATRVLQIFALAASLLSFPAVSRAQVSIGIAVNIAPPALPVYDQPICPGANYIWTPGYWAWNGYDYYWVPGTWVQAPSYGLLWTPGWWGWGNNGYLWHAGYWGPHIGFYGGVNYGFGYYGRGYEGGYWRGNNFYYNTAVSRVNTTVIRNVYVNRTVINNVNINRVSYNGGRGGIEARPSVQEDTALRERRMGAINAQVAHENVAKQDRANFFKSNRGVPATAALARPAASVNDFHRNSIPARPVNSPTNRLDQGNRPANNMTARPDIRPTPQNRPENTARPVTNGQAGNVNHPAPAQRPNTNENRATQPRPSPITRPENTARPAVQQHRPENSTARPETRPAPQQQARPEPRQQTHYESQQPHSAPQARPEAQPHPSEPHGEEHPHR